MDISVVFQVMLELLIIMIIGYVVAKLGYMNKASADMLSFLVVNLSNPLLVISSVIGKEGKLIEVMEYLGYGVAFYVASMLVAFIFCKLLFVKKKNMGTYQFMLIFSNCSFMGYPVVAAVLGKEAVFYISIFNIPFNLFAFSYGIFLLASSSGDGNKKGMDLKKFINPGIIASVIAIVIYACSIDVPKVLANVCASVGNLTTPISMIVIGVTLAGVPVKELFNEFRIYPMTVIRLAVLPIITYMVMSLFTSNHMLLGVATVTAAMPVASMAVMLSTLYGGNVKLATVGVFLSTVCSVITIPIILSLLL